MYNMDDFIAKHKAARKLAKQAQEEYEDDLMQKILKDHQWDVVELARTIMKIEKRYKELERRYYQDKAPEYSMRD